MTHRLTHHAMVWGATILTVLGTGISAITAKADTNPNAFINQLAPSVKSVANAYGLYPSLMMAQAALESGWGSSTLSSQANNYFGIKGAYNGQSVTMNTAEYDANGQLYYVDAAFKKYPTIAASMTDNAMLLKNGTSWNPEFYAGTWRVNAATPEIAAQALTGTYATAPSYGNTLAGLIDQYNLHSLLDGDSASDGSSGNGNNNNNNNSGGSSSSKYTAVKYYDGSGSETSKLSSKYSSYRLYNHVKNSRANVKKYDWSSVKATKGKKVWLDTRGIKQDSKTNWYRIRFSSSNSAKKYWVYDGALEIPKTTYQSVNTKGYVNHNVNNVLHTHVYNSDYLSESLGHVSDLGSTTTVDSIGTRVKDGKATTWYRVLMKNGKKAWVTSEAISLSKYDPVTYTPIDKTMKLSAKHANYRLYNHVKGAYGNMIKYQWSKVPSSKTGTKVHVEMTGFKPSSQTTWYRITFEGSSKRYWVYSEVLA